MRKNHLNSQLCKWKFTIISLWFQYSFCSLAEEKWLLLSGNTRSVTFSMWKPKFSWSLSRVQVPSVDFHTRTMSSHIIKHSWDPTTEHWPNSFLFLLEGTHFSPKEKLTMSLPASFITDQLSSGEIYRKKNLFPSQVSFTTFLRTLSQVRHLFILHLDLHRLPRILLAPPSPCETLPKFPKQGYLHHSIILNTAVEQEMKLWNKWSCRTPALFTSGKKKAIRTHWSYKKLFLKQR